jgi:hemerythrin superfamily protein
MAMPRKNNKPTLKEVMAIMGKMMIHLETLKADIVNNARVVDEYIQFQGDKDGFMQYLKDKLDIDDKDNKKTKDK